MYYNRAVPVGNLYCIDVTPPRVGGVILSTLAAVCSSDGERLINNLIIYAYVVFISHFYSTWHL